MPLEDDKKAITSETLNPEPSLMEDLNFPDAKADPDYQGNAQASFEALLNAYNEPAPEEAAQDDFQSRILTSLDTLNNEGARNRELEAEAGLPQKRKDFQGVITQMQGLTNEAKAIPLQIQQEFQGRGATAAGVAPIQTSRLRENAIKSLTLSTIGQTYLDDIKAAEATIKTALDAEFEPERNKLATLKELYQFNKDKLERIDKKRADNLNIILKERERLLLSDEKQRESIYNIGLEAARAGASLAEANAIYRAKSREEAVALASPFLSREFMAQQEQREFQNSISLRSLQIQEAQLRLSQDKNAYEQAQIQYDRENGILDEKELRDVDNSPQGKKVKSLGDLSLKLSAYKTLVDEYGTASTGKQKSTLAAAYADLKIAYKTAAELGAIQAPDVPIIEGAIRSATYDTPLGQIFSKFTGSGRVGSITAGLDQAAELIQSSGQVNIDQLMARNPKYTNSGYVQALVLPLLSTKTSVKIGGKEVPIGSIIQNAQGQKARVEADGSVTPL